MNKSTYEGLTSKPTGETVAWSNPDSGNSGEITPLRTFLSNDGKLCRDYRRTVNVAGEVQHTTPHRLPDRPRRLAARLP